ncbi:MAG TPA: hypothetical protein VFV58_32730 [Blastocatellia bacterium]|nr:hypothetical protein [Blastocatellia bacterium]
MTADRYYSMTELTSVIIRAFGYHFKYYDIPGFMLAVIGFTHCWTPFSQSAKRWQLYNSSGKATVRIGTRG